jgi:CO/xanthine dehydrogenase Mo-binding subunit
LGAGEAAHPPTAAAIGNAIFDALGVRVRDLPITRERIIAAMG